MTTSPDVVRTKGRLALGVGWYGAAVLLVVLLPSQLRFGEPLWELPSKHVPSLLVVGIAYLVGALTLEVGGFHFETVQQNTRQSNGRRLSRFDTATRLLAATLCFLAALLLIYLRPDLPYSRYAIAIGSSLGLALMLLPVLAPGAGRRALLGAGLAVVGTVGVGVRQAGLPTAYAIRSEEGVERPFIVTSEQFLRVRYQDGLVGRQVVRGGALEPYGDGFLLVTGSGEFYRLNWGPDNEVLEATSLPMRAPLNRNEFITDVGDPAPGRYFRVADLVTDTTASPTRVFVSHHYWNRENQCFTLRVSTAPLTEESTRAEDVAWRTLFEAEPCLPVLFGFENAVQSGGRLAWLGNGTLLLTVGDHGFDGVDGEALSQQKTAHYGKTVVLRPDGSNVVFSSGHRNPQGLAIDDQGTIWVTDQGPEGGDELNRVVQGGNYGWPLVTYGTQYQMTSWPLAEGTRDHGRFREPSYVWVPSPAVSGLIVVRSELFPAWRGDLLATSLRGRSLYRIRLRGWEAVYAEPIPIGRRIRDVAEARNGKIVLWTEAGGLVIIAATDKTDSGEALFAQCVSCHEAAGGSPSAGPVLRGIVGRPVAVVAGYPYSTALREVGGVWDIPRLARYLRDPGSFAPGTTMLYDGPRSEPELRTLLEYLRAYR